MQELINSLADMIHKCHVEGGGAKESARKWVLENITPKLWLVIDCGNPFEEKWKLFKNKDKALDWARDRGWQDPFGQGLTEQVGMENVYRCGETHIIIKPLEVQR